MLGEPVLLAGRAHGHEQDVRPGGADDRADLRALLVGEVAVVEARKRQPRVALGQARDGRLQHVLARAEDEDAIAAPLGQLEQPEHQVDAGHALGQRVAEEPRGPHDRLAVDAHEVAALDDRAQARIVAQGDDLGRR